jgi:cytochrome c5
VAIAAVTPGEAIYQQACAVCHAAGVGDAPIPGDAGAWSERLSLGRDTLLTSALEGKGIMPPKGGQAHLSDDDVAAAVDFILAQSAQ